MNSTKTLIGGALVLVALAFGAGYAIRGGSDDVDNSPSPSPTVSPTATATAVVATPKPMAYTVRLTTAGPVPSTLTIRAGDSVSFTNESGAPYWVASDPYTTRDQCPGFDSMRDLQNGDNYTLIFTTRHTCDYHNHSNPNNSALKGTIIVQ